MVPTGHACRFPLTTVALVGRCLVTSIYCPHCGEKRANVLDQIEKCANCGETIPSCPKCESRDTGFIDVYRMVKQLSRGFEHYTAFLWNRHWELIEERESIGKLKSNQLRFVLEVAQRMADRIPNFPRYSPFNPNEGHPDPERNYVDLKLKRYVKIGPLLQLRRSFRKSPNRKLPNEKHFAEKVLASNNPLFHPNENTRMKWAKAAREVLENILGLRKKRGVYQLRNEVIREYRLKGMSQEKICRELDFNEELQQKDPLLKRWRDEFLLPRFFGYLDAFNDLRFKSRIKRIISGVRID